MNEENIKKIGMEEKGNQYEIYAQNPARVYFVNYGITVGSGSSDSQYTAIGQKPVSAVQAGLNTCKIAIPLNFANLTVDGVFGELTASAVRQLQKYAGFPATAVDGWVGAQTWPVLEKYALEGFNYHR